MFLIAFFITQFSIIILFSGLQHHQRILGSGVQTIRPLGLGCISMPVPALALIWQFVIVGLLPSCSSIPLPPLLSIRQSVIKGDVPEQ